LSANVHARHIGLLLGEAALIIFEVHSVLSQITTGDVTMVARQDNSMRSPSLIQSALQ
jgi:hypothetical protein